MKQSVIVCLFVLGFLFLLPHGAHSAVPSDFNCDGKSDLAIGSPGEDIQSVVDAGVVNVMYGASGGVLYGGGDKQLWYQGSNGLIGIAETDDAFGSALATGDFNGDGCADLAIGAPGETIGTGVNAKISAGAVNVLYGSPAGLTATGNQLWSQGANGLMETAEEYDLFGYALATGDFNHDGYDDLAIGAPGETIGSSQSAGAVTVLYGSPTGLTATGNQLWSQGANGIIGSAETDDNFGLALATGDFNHDGYVDLAVGAPFEDIGKLNPICALCPPPVEQAGAVNVIYGSSTGLRATGNQIWYQGANGINGHAETDDDFGAALVTGDFDRDGYADLAIGAPGESIIDYHAINQQYAGAVNVIYGSSTGLTAARNRLLYQGNGGLMGSAEAGDLFGFALIAADFNHDTYTDLVVGAPGEDIGNCASGCYVDVGALSVIHGSATGLTSAGNELWYDGYLLLGGLDKIGAVLSWGDFDGDSYADLVLGEPQVDVCANANCSIISHNAGLVDVIYHITGTLMFNYSTQFGQEAFSQTPETGDHFGGALSH